jgi:hypothetical protein
LPPNGVFDSRWDSNRLVDYLNTGTKDILINSAEYPITLSVEGGDLSITDAAGEKALIEIVKNGQSITISNEGINKLKVKLITTPTTFELKQNYPNPFSARGGSASGGNPSTTINYQLPVTGLVTLKVYDVLGREIKTLVNEQQAAGTYSVTFNAEGLASGIYYYHLQAGSFMQTKKLVVVK